MGSDISSDGITDGITDGIRVTILGNAQDGGVPHIGVDADPAWEDSALRRSAAALGLTDGRSGERWLLEATPDIKWQLHRLNAIAGAPENRRRPVDGIAITHAHAGHYLGLAWLGREMLDAERVPVMVMPRMERFLRENLPWSDLIARGNIVPVSLAAARPHRLNDRLTIEAIPVPHRDEHSETVAFRLSGPEVSLLFMPDVDSWEDLDSTGPTIEELVASVDIALLDGTFRTAEELPDGSIEEIPHPLISRSIERFARLPESERGKIRFIHLNHSNPAERMGDPVAREGEQFRL